MQFDFRPIVKKFPKAVALLKEWILKQYSETQGIWISDRDGGIWRDEFCAHAFCPCECDFFFDEQGLHGGVFWDAGFIAKVHDMKKEESILFTRFKDRSDAKKRQYDAQFEILEERLNAGK